LDLLPQRQKKTRWWACLSTSRCLVGWRVRAPCASPCPCLARARLCCVRVRLHQAARARRGRGSAHGPQQEESAEAERAQARAPRTIQLSDTQFFDNLGGEGCGNACTSDTGPSYRHTTAPWCHLTEEERGENSCDGCCANVSELGLLEQGSNACERRVL
jgi:hypothetical protein